MDNLCSICFQHGDLFQIPGYSLPTCIKCSENISKGVIPNFYQNSRPTMVPTTSSILTQTLVSTVASTSVEQPKQKQNNVHFDLEQTLQNMDNEILVGEEGTCPVCSKTFNRKTSLLNHIRNHSAEKKYVCNYCQKGFTQQANLRNHERIHTNERPYVCVDCGKAFTQITNLNNHRRLHTGERPYVCIELNCGRSFAQVTNLNNHMKTHHKVQQYVCNQCPKKFTQVTHLNQHLTTHSGTRGFFCPQCPEKSFKQQSHLQQHMKIHGSNFGYSCTKCDEKFIQQSHLEQHMKQHGDYSCNRCSSTFNDENSLKKHIQRHLDGRLITCPIIGCNEGFSLKNQLTKHMQVHHPALSDITKKFAQKFHNSPGKCSCYFENCSETFTNTDQLNNHIRSVHGVYMIEVDKKNKNQHEIIININPQNGNCVASYQNPSNQLTGTTSSSSSGQSNTDNPGGKKVLSVSDLIHMNSSGIMQHRELEEKINNLNKIKTELQNNMIAQTSNLFNFNSLNMSPFSSSVKLVCNYCFNVFKTPQTLSRHIEKFHS